MDRRTRNVSVALGAIAALAACESSPPLPAYEPAAVVEDLGAFHRPITTASPHAQRAFDQGLLLCFGFEHDYAIRSFLAATEADPGCPMAWWGIALAHGPHINNPEMAEAASRAAHEALEKAQAMASNGSDLERELIDALAARYAWPAPADRKPLDRAYADAMREVHRRHPSDADVATLFAESLMNTRPWDLWTPEGEAKPETPEILATLEGVLAQVPDHPGATHLYIHAVEASPDPGRARAAADRLRHRAPGIGHLVHMPAHVDIRTGRYREAREANERAIAADDVFFARAGRGGFRELYHAHNVHFLVWAAMFEGRSQDALENAERLVREVPEEALAELPEFLEGFLSVDDHARVRFGRFEEILAEPLPSASQPSRLAFRRYARGVALAAQGRVDEAVAEREAFAAACEAVPEKYTIGNNPTATVLDVARCQLDGEILFRQGKRDEAFARLAEGAAQDDRLRYDEPWGWMTPVRHAWGALLLEAGRVEDAERVYRDDLQRYPENGWALHGLAECLERSGREDEARDVKARFENAWAGADVELEGSCYCRWES